MRHPLDTDTLLQRLHAAGVPQDAYHVGEPPWRTPADNTYVLSNVGRVWNVYYYERDSQIEPMSTLSEGEACAEMLRRIRRDFPELAWPAEARRVLRWRRTPSTSSDGGQRNQPKVWPARVRYPLIAAFAAFTVFGLVSAVFNGVEAATIRVLVSAVVIPALVVPFLVWGTGRRPKDPKPAPKSVNQMSPADLSPRIRAAGYSQYADRLDNARTSAATASEYLFEALDILQELLREHPRGMPPDLEDQAHTVAGNLAARLY